MSPDRRRDRVGLWRLRLLKTVYEGPRGWAKKWLEQRVPMLAIVGSLLAGGGVIATVSSLGTTTEVNCAAINGLRDGLVRFLNVSQRRELDGIRRDRAAGRISANEARSKKREALRFYRTGRQLVGPIECRGDRPAA